MQHAGDLQPPERSYARDKHVPAGRYSAKRSRWRLAIGSLEIGFDRASEKIQAETGKAEPDWVQRALILFGMLCVSLLVIALVGWMWSTRGPILGGATVSAAIIERSGTAEGGSMSAQRLGSPTDESTASTAVQRPAFLRAVIEKRPAAPALAPTPKASVEIARGVAFAPRPAQQETIAVQTPDNAIVESGNFLLIAPVERAVNTAMHSGEAQSWTAGDYHGIVVVGDAELKDQKSCRTGTILLRDGSSKGRTQSFHRCH